MAERNLPDSGQKHKVMRGTWARALREQGSFRDEGPDCASPGGRGHGDNKPASFSTLWWARKSQASGFLPRGGVPGCAASSISWHRGPSHHLHHLLRSPFHEPLKEHVCSGIYLEKKGHFFNGNICICTHSNISQRLKVCKAAQHGKEAVPCDRNHTHDE